MTQLDVAKRLGISRPAVAAFERYDADPRLSTVRRYALAIRAHLAHTLTPESKRSDSLIKNALGMWLVASNRQHVVVSRESHDAEERPNSRAYHSAVAKLLVK